MAYSSEVRQALENPECCATLLHTICLRQYGQEWYTWDPSTVELELRSDFQPQAIPAENMDKISAIQILVSSSSFFDDPAAFCAICSTIADGNPLFDVFDPPSLEEISWAVSEVALNRELLPFSDAIKALIRAIGEDYGFNKNQMPTAIREMLEDTPDEEDIQDAFSAIFNGENIDTFMLENTKEMSAQFENIPGIAELFPVILEKGVIPALQQLQARM